MRSLGVGALAVIRALRTAWDILGVTLALTVVALLALAGGRAVMARGSAPSRNDPAHPYAAEAWRPAFIRESVGSFRMRWEPYVYWQRRPFRGRWINVDSAGFRITPQPVPAAAATRFVWFFGGSTIWGTGQRDSMTIPAVVARTLAEHGRAGVHVRNFGESGYVSTQELLRLELELRAGARPEVVVFYDGINDAAAGAMNERCGQTQNEGRRRFEFALGRLLSVRGAGEFADVIHTARGQSRLAFDLRSADQVRATPELDALGRGVVDCYARNVRLIEALAAGYGFTALYFWQPTPSATAKPLTPFERRIADSTSTDGLRPYLWVMNRVTARGIDSALAPLVPGRHFNLAGLFNGDSGSVWLDYLGHLTERANRSVAMAMVPPILARLPVERPGPLRSR